MRFESSVIAPVGTPPDQKKASICPRSSASADSVTPSCSRLNARRGTFATSSIRSATTWVPESGEPTLTRLPLRSASVPMRELPRVTTWT